jgi:scyllo-inositol 2-dehydrogenase (NADP+)
MRLKVGLVGAGKMGISHFAIVNAHDDAEVVAVCDTTGYVLSVLKKQTGVQVYRDYREMIDQAGLDAVIIATPTATHFECARYALSRGLHLFVEKPLTLGLTQSQTLCELADRAKVVNQVGFHNRFIGTFQEARRLIAAGALGEVYHLSGSAFGQVVSKEASGMWRSKKSEGGGCLHDYACHVIDLMNSMVGPPRKVRGARLQQVFSQDVEDAVYAVFEYGNGASGQLETNWSDTTFRKMTTTIVVNGTGGKLIADRQELKVFLKAPFESYGEGWTLRYITDLQKPVSIYLRGEEYSAQIDAFIAAIQSARRDGNTTHENSFASACEADRAIELITQAAA